MRNEAYIKQIRCHLYLRLLIIKKQKKKNLIYSIETREKKNILTFLV